MADEELALINIVRVNKKVTGKNKPNSGKIAGKNLNKMRRNTMLGDGRVMPSMIVEEVKEGNKRKGMLSPHHMPKRPLHKGSKLHRKGSDPLS
jgi:hypothetical protein